MSQYIVRKQISLKASPGEVWDALTNPEKTKKYFFHCKVYSDWQPGSPIRFKGRIFLVKKIEMKGRILKAEPGKILQYRLENGSDGKTHSVVTDELSYADGQTTLSITDDVGSGEGAEKRQRRSEKGWDKILAGLKDLIEK
jgi:uncharacterized protein YndB with AHSA1/START domain